MLKEQAAKSYLLYGKRGNYCKRKRQDGFQDDYGTDTA